MAVNGKQVRFKNQRFGVRETCPLILVPLLHMAKSKLLTNCESQFPYLQNGYNIFFTRLLLMFIHNRD